MLSIFLLWQSNSHAAAGRTGRPTPPLPPCGPGSRPARWIWWPSAFLHLPVDELVAVIAGAGSWLAPGGRLLYLGHALDNFTHGVGGPPDPSILPAIDDLARAASGLQVHELEHLVRPVGEGRAIDVLLHAQPWGAAAHRDLKSGTFT